MRVAYHAARQCLPAHSSRFGRHDFTLGQLFACLAVSMAGGQWCDRANGIHCDLRLPCNDRRFQPDPPAPSAADLQTAPSMRYFGCSDRPSAFGERAAPASYQQLSDSTQEFFPRLMGLTG